MLDYTHNYSITMSCLCIINLIFLSTLSLCQYSPEILSIIWMCIIFACVGGNFAIFPTEVTFSFGKKK